MKNILLIKHVLMGPKATNVKLGILQFLGKIVKGIN